MGVPPVAEFFLPAQVLVADIEASGPGGNPVDDHDLPVEVVVDPVPGNHVS